MNAYNFLLAGSFIFYFRFTTNDKISENKKLGRYQCADVSPHLHRHCHNSDRRLSSERYEYFSFQSGQSSSSGHQYYLSNQI